MKGLNHTLRSLAVLALLAAAPAGAVSMLDDDGFGDGFGAEFGAPQNDPYAEVRAGVAAGDYARVLPDLRRLLEADPDNPDTFRLLGAALQGAGDIEGAAQALGRALELAPGDREALSLRGELFLMQNLPEKAFEVLEQISRDCITGCAEKSALEQAIKAWKAQQ